MLPRIVRLAVEGYFFQMKFKGCQIKNGQLSDALKKAVINVK